MKKLSNNLESFKKEAKQYFVHDTIDNFKYRVATNFINYDTENVEYVPGDFQVSFMNLIKANPYTQLTEVFPDYYDKNIYEHIKSQVDASIHFTASDAGSVKVGNESFDILIPNGYGDGTTENIVTSGKAHVPLRFFTTIKGRFYIYNSDCGESAPEAELNGEYAIYAQDQTVVFMKHDI